MSKNNKEQIKFNMKLAYMFKEKVDELERFIDYLKECIANLHKENQELGGE